MHSFDFVEAWVAVGAGTSVFLLGAAYGFWRAGIEDAAIGLAVLTLGPPVVLLWILAALPAAAAYFADGHTQSWFWIIAAGFTVWIGLIALGDWAARWYENR